MTTELLRCSECGAGDEVFKCRFCERSLCGECCTEIQSELECCAMHEAQAVDLLKHENGNLLFRQNIAREALMRIICLAKGSTVNASYADAVGAIQGRAEFVLERMK